VPTSAANSIGAFPVTSGGSTIANGGQNVFSSGITPTTGSTTATITGILTNPNFQVVLHALETRTGVETLGEPEITTLSGRQTQMRATTVQTIVVGVSFQQGQSATTSTGLGATP
jgi:Flp pilus assembly secretin CpaC